MVVTSDNKELQLLLSGNSKAVRSFGQQRYKLLQRRVKVLQQADTLEDVRNVSGHFHELTENRKGQYLEDCKECCYFACVKNKNRNLPLVYVQPSFLGFDAALIPKYLQASFQIFWDKHIIKSVPDFAHSQGDKPE